MIRTLFHSAPRARRRDCGYRPRVEALEDRIVPTQTYLVLDFWHDWRGGSLAQSFNAARFRNGRYPRFLDMDSNNVVNRNDVAIAARAIANRVHLHYRPYVRLGVRVLFGDATRNTRFAWRWLTYGRRAGNDVTVAAMYFGGRRSGVWGRAPLAPPGQDVEGLGRVYSDGHAIYYRDRAARGLRVTRTEFINAIAATTSHELGHMVGLRHVRNVSYHLMTTGGSRNHARAFFPNRFFRTDTRLIQNAHHELIRSFLGQRERWQIVSDWRDTPEHSHAHAHDAPEMATLDRPAVVKTRALSLLRARVRWAAQQAQQRLARADAEDTAEPVAALPLAVRDRVFASLIEGDEETVAPLGVT